MDQNWRLLVRNSYKTPKLMLKRQWTNCTANGSEHEKRKKNKIASIQWNEADGKGEKESQFQFEPNFWSLPVLTERRCDYSYSHFVASHIAISFRYTYVIAYLSTNLALCEWRVFDVHLFITTAKWMNGEMKRK